MRPVDRQKLQEKFRLDSKYKESFNRILDKYEKVITNHTVEHTDFMNPETVSALMPVITFLTGVGFEITGGYPQSEYKILILYPYYMFFDESETPLTVVRMIPKTKHHELEHRDVLGSVLSVGIKREKTGDILIHEEFIQIVVLENMGPIISSQLEKIRKTPIEITIEDLKDLVLIEEEVEHIETVISSERLDAVLASVWRISRGKAADLIRAEKVKVNYQPIKSVGFSIKSGDMISCRGKGRFYYDGILNNTRKDRIRVKIRKII